MELDRTRPSAQRLRNSRSCSLSWAREGEAPQAPPVVQEPNALPTRPLARYHSVAPPFVNSVSRPEQLGPCRNPISTRQF
jgi:hypothetical protein